MSMCRQGHMITGDNVVVQRFAGRVVERCRICWNRKCREAQRRYRARHA